MEDLLDNFLIVLNISISEKLVSMEAQSIETISLSASENFRKTS